MSVSKTMSGLGNQTNTVSDAQRSREIGLVVGQHHEYIQLSSGKTVNENYQLTSKLLLR